jgi:membrane protease subunit HflC
MDVRIKRVDLPSEVSESVYRRMDAERKRVANELRSTGSAEAEKIRADADKQREVIIAEAYRDAQRTKGEGDGRAAAIYSEAFGKNPEFYAFYRSMEPTAELLQQERCDGVAAEFRVLPLHEIAAGGGK